MEAWTICKSVHKDIPPSQWELSIYQQNCFQRHDIPPFATDATTAPGTALFQHWIRDDSYQNETSPSSSAPSWDPWNDFPNENIMKLYPDISDDDAARDYYTLWYTTTVVAPNNNYDRRGHLTLHGVNYQPIVYFDGEMLRPYTIYSEDNDANENHDSGGMFLRRHYDLGLSKLQQSVSSSALEILVLPPPFVGRPCKEACTTIDCQGGDHNIAKSGAIMQCTAGWDWISPTPDRNTGIWDEVEIEWTLGDVKLHDVWVKTSNIVVESDGDYDETSKTTLPLGDDVTVSALIDLAVTATYHGPSKDPIDGSYSYWITPYSSHLPPSPEQLESSALASGTIYNVTIDQCDADFHLGKIRLPKAKLWWPHTHGSQPLYLLQVVFRSSDNTYESRVNTSFGVRTVSSEIGAASKSFTLKINGHPIFLAGGNWITSDQFLRFSNSRQRYFNELMLMANAGFNSIRIWGGGITETRQFYEVADEVGMLIYQEFWMTGDNNGRFAGEYDWPTDHVSYILNVRDVIRKLRNHPSLAFFGGGNELYPIDLSPPRDIDEQIRRYIRTYDGSRPYVSSSVTEVGDSFDPLDNLAPKDGPYGILKEEDFFDRNPGFTSPLLSVDELAHNVSIYDIKNKRAPGRNIGFQAEIGSVSHPELESLKRFLSSDALKSFPGCGVTSCFQVDQAWNYLKWLPFTEGVSGVDRICQLQYPPINNLIIDTRMDSIEDYSWAAQFVQYDQYNALVQGYSHRVFEWHSAFYIWKTSSPSPTLRGSLYDWYLATNGGYWGTRAGLSGPVRLNFNRLDWTLQVVNTLPTAFVGTNIRWTAYTLNGTRVAGDVIPVQAQLIAKLPWIQIEQEFMPELQNILLYRIEVGYKDERDSTIHSTRNDYYLTDPSIGSHSQSRYALLGAYRKVMQRVRLEVTCTAEADSMDIACKVDHLQKETIAIMARFTLVLDPSMPDESDNRILPSFYSQNYITLLPGESSNVSINATKEQKETWTCLPDGYVGVGTRKRGGFFLMVSVDGYNVAQQTVLISCIDLLATT
ncbi:hypothetical protein ACHAWT_006894 [Skeletonema menzelii]